MDSYAVENNIHFPTDINLAWDSLGKCLDTVATLLKEQDLSGLRKIKYLRRKARRLYRQTADTHRLQRKAVTKRNRLTSLLLI